MASSLESLPTELLAMIATECVIKRDHEDPDVDALLLLRQTSRTIQGATRGVLLRTCFVCRYVFLSVAKLTELRDMSSIPEFSKRVNTLRFVCRSKEVLLSTREGDQMQLIETAKNNPDREIHTLEAGFLLVAALRQFSGLRDIVFQDQMCKPKSPICPGDLPVDVSDTIDFVLLALQACCLRPSKLWIIPSGSKSPNIAICNFRSISPFANVISAVESYRLVPGTRSVSDNRDMRPFETGQQIADNLRMMSSLNSLEIDFSQYRKGAKLLDTLAEHVHLEHLGSIRLARLNCDITAVTKILCNHAPTLTLCSLTAIASTKASHTAKYRELFVMLRDRFELRRLELKCLLADHRPRASILKFPLLEGVTVGEEPDEDGFMVVELSRKVLLGGRKRVKKGIDDMLNSMQWVPVKKHMSHT